MAWLVAVRCVARRSAVVRGRYVSVSAPRGVFEVADEKDFRTKVLESSKPVVVDFHAEWCGPCRTLGPLLEKEVGGRKGMVELAKVDVDKFQELAMQYDVTAVPTVLGVRSGKVTDRFVGAQDVQFIREFLQRLDSQS